MVKKPRKAVESVNEMGMTNKQFQGFVRLTLSALERALEESPNNQELQELIATFRAMLEDS